MSSQIQAILIPRCKCNFQKPLIKDRMTIKANQINFRKIFGSIRKMNWNTSQICVWNYNKSCGIKHKQLHCKWKVEYIRIGYHSEQQNTYMPSCSYVTAEITADLCDLAGNPMNTIVLYSPSGWYAIISMANSNSNSNLFSKDINNK